MSVSYWVLDGIGINVGKVEPWHRTESEPESIDEVHRRIINAIKKITSLSDEEIDEMIDDEMYIFGVG